MKTTKEILDYMTNEMDKTSIKEFIKVQRFEDADKLNAFMDDIKLLPKVERPLDAMDNSYSYTFLYNDYEITIRPYPSRDLVDKSPFVYLEIARLPIYTQLQTWSLNDDKKEMIEPIAEYLYNAHGGQKEIYTTLLGYMYMIFQSTKRDKQCPRKNNQ